MQLSAKEILNILTGQVFDDFYKGELEDFITGEEGALTEEEILDAIHDLFS